ncbi:MAG: MFS transporter, partial [Bacillota bacterium]|nr:MFS transporter [Bacillota bacterium]
MKAENKTGFIRNLPFMQLLTGEIVSAVGDTFQFVAITVLLYNLTGSGLSAAFGVICTPMTSILLSPFAGSLGDKFSEKYMLVFLDLFRAFLVTFLIGSSNTFEIYLILILLAALGTLYGPPYKKIMVHILDKKNIVAGNSIFTGVSGVVYIIGPLAASALMNRYGLDTAFYINSFSFVFSALMILFIKFDKKQITSVRKNYRPNYNLFNGIKEGFKYCRKDRQIKHLILIGTIISLGTASVNIAFYPYVFNILKVSSEEWGIMISVFYGTNLISMFLAVLFEKFFKGRIMTIVYLLFSATSVVWFMYAL